MSVCRRCGHSRHCHLLRDLNRCTVKTVSGPPTPPDARVPAIDRPGMTDEELHPGRTVVRCECTGFLE